LRARATVDRRLRCSWRRTSMYQWYNFENCLSFLSVSYFVGKCWTLAQGNALFPGQVDPDRPCGITFITFSDDVEPKHFSIFLGRPHRSPSRKQERWGTRAPHVYLMPLTLPKLHAPVSCAYFFRTAAHNICALHLQFALGEMTTVFE
jgi:hypothetical protein